MVNRQASSNGINKFALNVKTPVLKGIGNSILARKTLNEIHPAENYLSSSRKLYSNNDLLDEINSPASS
jgi:hypothetical protein